MTRFKSKILNRRELFERAGALAITATSFSVVGGASTSLQARAAASSDQLTIGVGSELTTLDPHFYDLTPNSEATFHIFESLISWDALQKMGPGLAKSWTTPSDDTWIFALRDDVKFHDGTPFTAEDVIFSLNRAPNVPNSPAGFGQYTARIQLAEAIDPYTLRITTKGAHPLLLSDLSAIAIVSHTAGANATTDDYNSGKVTIGTGPYRLKEWLRGDRMVYERNESYWGKKPAWKTVVVKPITNSAARLSALLAGDVDIINQVPTGDVSRLKQNGNIRITQIEEPRLFYVAPDVERDKSPFVTDKTGQPLDRNPLRDVRVRRAISKAINREQLVEKMMDGLGTPTGQFMPKGMPGYNPAMKAEAFDLEGAKKLLVEAGYPEGFGMTIHGPNDRYVNDAKIVQAIAQMLSRIGIAVKVETMPKSVYFTKVSNFEFSFQFIGSSPNTGAGGFGLENYVVHTRDPNIAMGAGNQGRYSNKKVDALVEQASVTIDDSKREKLIQQAAEVSIGEDVGIIPLFHGIIAWAMRKDLNYIPRADAFTLAEDVTPA